MSEQAWTTYCRHLSNEDGTLREDLRAVFGETPPAIAACASCCDIDVGNGDALDLSPSNDEPVHGIMSVSEVIDAFHCRNMVSCDWRPDGTMCTYMAGQAVGFIWFVRHLEDGMRVLYLPDDGVLWGDRLMDFTKDTGVMFGALMHADMPAAWTRSDSKPWQALHETLRDEGLLKFRPLAYLPVW